MSKRATELPVATQLNSQDQFIFFSNVDKKMKRVARDDMFGSNGIADAMPASKTDYVLADDPVYKLDLFLKLLLNKK